MQFKHVKTVREGEYQHPFIYFELNGFDYYMTTVLHNLEGIFSPYKVYHKNKKEKCPVCEKKGYQCEALTEKIEEIFPKLIECNSTRLDWLFIPHNGIRHID